MPATSKERTIDAKYPWPGLESYREEDAAFFHGRAGEIQALANRVDHHILTILFSASGLGKTSLLKAGLSPILRRRGLLPIYLRLDHSDDSPTPVQQVWSGLRDHLNLAPPYDTADGEENAKLWEWFHDTKLGLLSPSLRGVMPVLIFDQFEEMFTIGAGGKGSARDEESMRFLNECADLAENCPPDSLTERIETDEREGDRFDFDLSNFRILITLREAYLPQLERLREKMPSVMQNRVPLDPLSGKRALEAVTGPGGQLVTPEVAEKIVRFVGREESLPLDKFDVEPPLLSLVCRELNHRRIDQNLDRITEKLIEGNQEDILEGYYDECFRGLPDKARHWVEDELLTNAGYRDSEAYETGQRRAGAESVKQLIDARLLHLDFRGRIPRIELTHDVLARVVDKSRTKRYEREARLKAEQERKEAQERETRIRKERLQARIAAGVMGLLALLSVSLLGMVIVKWQDAKDAEEKAKLQKAEAKSTKIMAVEFFRLMSGDELIDALRDVGELQSLSNVYTRAIDELGESDPQLRFGLFEGRGRIHHAHGNYREAVSDLNHALEIAQAFKPTTTDEEVIRDRYQARAQFRLAIIRKEQNDLAGAEKFLMDAIGLQRAISEIPVIQEALFLKSQTKANDELADTYEEFGFMLLAKTKRYPEAEKFLRESLSLRNALLDLPTTEQAWRAKRARTNTYLGSCIAKQKTRNSEAIEHYEKGLGEFEELAALDLRHGQWKLAHEMAILEYGEWLREAQEFDKSENHFQQIIDRFTQLNESRSGDKCLNNTKAVGLLGMADFRSRRDESEVAEKLLREAIAIHDKEVDENPSSIEAQRGASAAHQGLAEHFARHGKYSEAVVEFAKAIAHMEKLIAIDSGNEMLKNELAFLFDSLAYAFRDQGKFEEAKKEYEKGFAIRTELVEQDPTNAEWKLDLSRSYNYMGDLDRLEGKYQSSLDFYKQALAIREILLKAAPEDPIWKARTAYCYGQLGRGYKYLKNSSESIKNHKKALEIRLALVESDANNSTWAEDLASSHIDLGEVQVIESQGKEAQANFEAAQRIREDLLKREPASPGHLAGLAECEFHLGTISSMPISERRRHLQTAIRQIESLGEKVRVERREWLDTAKMLQEQLAAELSAR